MPVPSSDTGKLQTSLPLLVPFFSVVLRVGKTSFNGLPRRFFDNFFDPPPPNIIKSLPASISRRLTDISSDETAFGDAKPMYDKALADSGFCETTEFLEDRKEKTEEPSSKRYLVQPSVQPECFNGHRPEILYSDKQAFSKELEALENLQHQHPEAELQLFVQYGSCDQSTQQLDPSGGRTIGESYAGGRPCNCRVKKDCPLNGTCQVQSVVYKAIITTMGEARDYTCLTAQTFKQRYNAHQRSMTDSIYRHSMSLLKHVWALKDQHVGYNTFSGAC